MPWIRVVREGTLEDVGSVGRKDASLGELLRELAALGVPVADGCAVTADADHALMRESGAGAFAGGSVKGDRGPSRPSRGRALVE
jgi:pyruvate, water dikinase